MKNALSIKCIGVIGCALWASGAYAQIVTSGQISASLYSPASNIPISDSSSNADAVAANSQSLNVNGRNQVYNGTTWDRQRGTVNGTSVIQALDPTSVGGAAPTTVYASTGNTYKTSSGNVSSLTFVNSTAAGMLILTNLAAVPASGAAITAATNYYCMAIPASNTFRDTFPIPVYFSVGITMLFSTSCTIYTPVGTAPIQMTVQFK